MSPKVHTVAGSEAPGTPEASIDHEVDDDPYGDIDEDKTPPKSGDPQQKLLDLLTNLTERMERMKASQQRQEEKERFSGRESSVFESAIGLGRAMDRRALNQTPPPRDPPVSPATYFGLKQRGYGYENAAANVEMAQAPQQVLPQYYVPPRTYQQPAQPPAMPQGIQVPLNGFPRVPDTRQRKLGIRHFDGKELYQGLGSGFLSWGKRFVRQIQFAERASGFQWSEEVKVDILGHHLTGMAERYYNQQVECWWEEELTLEHAMQRLLHTFATKITPAQSMKMFTAQKNAKRSWTEHCLYLVAISEACRRADNLVLDNIVHYADPAMCVSMLSRLKLNRTDYLLQTEELAHFAQSTEIELHGKQLGLWQQGHMKVACPKKKKEWGQDGEADYVLAVNNATIQKGLWILDTGSSRHLVNDASLLENPEDFESQCVAADGGAPRVTKCGSMMLETTATGKRTKVRLLNVQYLVRNIISYGLLEKKGFKIEYRGPHRVIAAMDGGPAVFDVERCNIVLVVRSEDYDSAKNAGDELVSVVADSQAEVGPDVQTGTLMHFHRRLGPLNYDTILKMAKDPASVISLTDEKRANCLVCAQGKQTKNKHSQKDSGSNSPIDIIGGVICSDLKGPMTPRDRLGNRYMVNFIDHRTNYCRIVLAKTKDVAAQQFKRFMAFFERQFNYRIHVLRADGEGEYQTLDLDIVVFGSPCTVHQDAKNKSLGERGKPAMIIGKSDEMKGYRVYIPKDKVVVVTQHVRNVKTLTDEQNDQLRCVHLESSEETKEDEGKPSAQGTTTTPKSRPKCLTKDVLAPNVANSVREADPKNYGQAMRSVLKDKWEIAMTEDIKALEENGVWTVVVPRNGSHVLHTKRVFKTKTDADGTIERFKARLVACGNEQLFGIDYGLTFAAVMELSTVKVILVFARRWDVPARHGDIPNANTKLALRLKKSLYVRECFLERGMTIVGVYVDDFLVTASTANLVDDFFTAMSVLSIKDLGVVRKFLGMRVELDEADGYALDQQAAIEELMAQYGLADANGATKDLKLWMRVEAKGGCPIGIESWSDADFAGDKGDRKSFTGGVMTMDGAIVQWICKKQTGVSLSAMEAEFISASHVGRELLGLRELVRELEYDVVQPMPMHMDNQAAIKQLESENSMVNAKHVDNCVKFVCDSARKGIVKPEMAELREAFNLK
ncbi:Mitochondrial Carrier (MC) Family [Phytophthora palmivora]|uniref:Mitochondrial Carrier (MC) Family n=1 Tax=Phytophthora palmivora TaxID=4796 RepID=A0A2P4X064_9STRA|nr:Mitochondrial Carrier (MC) Family [Phytophthora palmivora]